MQKTKLTVRVPRDLLEGGKRYASEHGTTLTRLISEFLRQLTAQSDPLADASIVQRLFGFSFIALHKQQLSLQPVKLCLPVALARLFHKGERLGQYGHSFLWVAPFIFYVLSSKMRSFLALQVTVSWASISEDASRWSFR